VCEREEFGVLGRVAARRHRSVDVEEREIQRAEVCHSRGRHP
jgi:plasmid stability protein